MIELPFIFKLSILFLISFILGFLFNLIKQPLIIAYIISGIIAGNYLIDSLETKNILSIFSEIGVALMLFIVGLELKLKVIKDIGKNVAIIAILQELSVIILGFVISLILGFNHIESLYIGIALSFSSTIIIIKLLSDKGDLEKFYGKLAIGFLIIQDIISIILILLIPFFSLNKNFINLENNLLIISFVILLIFFTVRYLIPKLENLITKTNELLFIFSFSFVLLLSSLFKLVGIGLEIGALIAGLILANYQFSSEINFKLRPIKNFFLIIFFIYLGLNIKFPQIENELFKILTFSFFILIIQPIISFFLLKLLKIGNRQAFKFSLISAQISEFSFIIIGLGNKLGQIENNLFSTISFIGIITIFLSIYMFYYSDKIYNLIFKKILKIKDRVNIDEEIKNKNFNILLIGCDRTGYSFLLSIKENKEKILIIENNYQKVLELKKINYNVIYGDIDEFELLDEINLKQFKIIISTIPDFETNLILLRRYKKDNPKGIFICNSNKFKDNLELYKNGASFVNLPHSLGGEKIADLVNNFGFEIDEYEAIKKENFEKIYKIINYLKI
ncbi:MAG: sodium/hydrogen exchanger family/TrkA domain protein [Candidatus Parcubacteria bacterium]|nr:MAG: sodium/hydrogen exchanger family/TrkA domain protein [Candidatus Parcubacteria bacterium]